MRSHGATGDNRLNRCGFCGRDNDEQSRFCIDCGKPIVFGGARVISVAALSKSSGPAGEEATPVPSLAKGVPDTRVSATAQPKGSRAAKGEH